MDSWIFTIKEGKKGSDSFNNKMLVLMFSTIQI